MTTPSPTVLAIHGAICEDSIEECLDCYGLCMKAGDAINNEATVLAAAIADSEGQRLATAAANLAPTWGKEWASQNNFGAKLLWPFDTREAADKETARHPELRTTVSRVVGPWTEDRS